MNLAGGKETGGFRVPGLNYGHHFSAATLPDGSVPFGTSKGERGRKIDKFIRSNGL